MPMTTTDTKPTHPRSRTGSRQRPGFLLQTRDLGILRTVIQLRVLSTPQIAGLYFPTESGEVSSACRSRLRLLTQAGYLERHFQLQQPTDGRLPHLFMPAAEGVALVASELGAEEQQLDWQPSYNSVSWPFLAHQLALNDVYVAFRKAAAPGGWMIGHWVDDRLLKRTHTATITLEERGKSEKVGVVPDAYMSLELQRPPWQLHFFIERDRGTMPATAGKPLGHSWHRRILAYNAAFDEGLFERQYGTSRIRVLTVTDGRSRLKTLKATTEKAGGRGRYWFATVQDLEDGNPYTRKIWYRAGEDKKTALLQD